MRSANGRRKDILFLSQHRVCRDVVLVIKISTRTLLRTASPGGGSVVPRLGVGVFCSNHNFPVYKADRFYG